MKAPNLVDLIRKHRNALAVFVGTLSFSVGTSWMADAVDWKEKTFSSGIFATGLALSILGAYLAIHFGKKLFSVTSLSQKTGTYPHKVLFIFMSAAQTPPSRKEDRWVLENNGQSVELDPRLEEVLQQQIKGIPFPWQQTLRAINAHYVPGGGGVEAIYLIGSKDENETKGNRHQRLDGSHGQLDKAIELIRFYFPELKTIEARPRDQGVDFEDMKALLDLLRELMEEAKQTGYKEEDIMIDVTGGQKTNSIAGALVTIHHPKLEFQYVGTRAPYTLKTFNAVAVEHGDL